MTDKELVNVKASSECLTEFSVKAKLRRIQELYGIRGDIGVRVGLNKDVQADKDAHGDVNDYTVRSGIIVDIHSAGKHVMYDIALKIEGTFDYKVVEDVSMRSIEYVR